jgi:predicted exporter
MHRRSIPALWLTLLLLAAWLATQATYVADLSAFLPSAPSAEQRVLLEQLKSGATSRVILIGIRGADAAARATASRQLADQLRRSPHFDAVHNGDTTGGDWAATGELLFAHRYLLSPAVDAERFSASGLRAAIDDTVALLGTPAGTLIKPLLWRDPTGESVRLAEAMLPAAAPRIEQGVWVSREQARALLVASTRAEGADLDGQAAAVASVRAAFAPLAAQGVQLELSGPPVLAVQARSEIQHAVERLGLFGLMAVVALLLLAFGSLPALLIALLPVASGVLAGIAAVSLGFGTVHGMTLGFGTTLIGEAVDYAIYYLVQARPLDGLRRGDGHKRWRHASWPTVRLGLLTSIAGFAALVFSGFGGLAQLGVFSVAGLVAAALTTRHVLPLLAPDGARGLGLRRPLGRATGRAAHALARARWPLAALSLLALGLLLVQPSAWRGHLAELSPVPAAALALDASLRTDLGAVEAGTLVAVEAADEAAVLARAEQAGQRLDALVQQGRLQGYESPARLLPAPATQRARQAALPDEPTLRQRLAEATRDGPLPAARLDGFIADVQAQRSAAVVHRADLAGTALGSALAAQLLPGSAGRPWTALLSLQAPADAAELRRALAGLPDTRVVQVQAELDALYARYLHEALWQAALGGMAVVLLLGLQLRAARRLLRVLAPLAAALVLVLAGLTLAGSALGVLHLVGLLLVVALGSNYALFFDHFAQGGAADDDTLASLLLANLTAVTSFGLLALSTVPALAALGQVVAPGAGLALLLSAAFLGPRTAAGPKNAVGQSAP